MRKCANCGAEVEDGDRFCMVCGMDEGYKKPSGELFAKIKRYLVNFVLGKKVCSNCDYINRGDALYCDRCGIQLSRGEKGGTERREFRQAGREMKDGEGADDGLSYIVRIKCAGCGELFVEGAQKCDKCGMTIEFMAELREPPDVFVCKKCGKVNQGYVRACEGCGEVFLPWLE